MRLRFSAVVCIVALSTVWSQEATAGGSDASDGPSAYDILGVSPSTDDSASVEESSVLLVEETAPVDDATADEETGVAETEPIIMGTANEGVVEGSPEESSETSVNQGVSADDPALVSSGNVVAEESVQVEPTVSEIESVAEPGDEEILLAEIIRLLAERDVLYETINELKEENMALAAAAADSEYYKARSEELQSEITRLEAVLVEKDAAIIEADGKLTEMETRLAEEGARLADAEGRLVAGGADSDAIATVIAGKDAEIAEKDAELSDKTAMIASRDEALLAREDALVRRDEEIALRDKVILERDEELASINSRLEGAVSELEQAKAALAAAEARGSVPVAEMSETVPSSAETDKSVTSAIVVVEEAEKRIAAISAERDAALASRDAAEKARLAAESSRSVAEAALAAAKASGAVVPATATTSVEADVASEVPAVYLSGWKLDTSKFEKKLRDGFDGSLARMGAWKITGATASQTDAMQYFSRLELPLAQSKVTTLYRFKARSTGKDWIGLGLHLYVENVKKQRGYGEGESLLVWFTRDKDARGDDATYLQLYRSDDDVVMERMFDAELADGIESWRLVEIVYDPGAEYIAVSVDGVLRIVYKTFFGRDSGATVSLRTLGGGASFSDFSVWSE